MPLLKQIFSSINKRIEKFLYSSTTAISTVETEDKSTDQSLQSYDKLIFDPLIRKYFDSEFYNVGYWEKHIHTQNLACHNLVDKLFSFVIKKPSTILDVACGLGATTQKAKNRWIEAQVIGINFSEKQIQRCRQNAPLCSFKVMDATELAFPDSQFDLLMSIEAVFHFNSRQDFILEASRILKPNGNLILTDMIFNPTNLSESWLVPQCNQIDNIRDYEILLTEAGFENRYLEDATDLCWKSFCNNLETWVDAEYSLGKVEYQEWQKWKDSLPTLINDVRHYMIVHATKVSN
ncbi:class I SAM-dependent methyltransferase [Geminocystis sp. GBBB08]|uniref:class I SAM-dependent methyltransferase n=1 Tax=Geminocystis sp. GBBB08 TaxID=2604140 RepID=UPI0027E34F0D|nr:class I SAM-dependent methyltransferase [Geminocystis sp. GBBB08]MBL1208606.1 class I SAM-dependent methyltransferase [Geminocystis sp. GBBB08]